jgi:hypothetical protein
MWNCQTDTPCRILSNNLKAVDTELFIQDTELFIQDPTLEKFRIRIQIRTIFSKIVQITILFYQILPF